MIGTGILKGMAVTARNFVGSYFEKERLITVQYPEERNPLPENYRNFPFLIYDGNDPHAGLRCVACKICEKECPPQCIYIVKSEDKKPDYMGKPQFYPKVFDIDISVCMSCQICVEVCPFEAIKMDKEFEQKESGRGRTESCHCRVAHASCAGLAQAGSLSQAPCGGSKPLLLAIANRKSKIRNPIARVAKLADAPDLGSGGEILRGSIFALKNKTFPDSLLGVKSRAIRG